jgi:hypothetical protein
MKSTNPIIESNLAFLGYACLSVTAQLSFLFGLLWLA